MKTLKSKISLGVIFLFAVILLLSVLGIMFINHLAHKSKGTIVEVFDHFAKFRDDAQIKELIEKNAPADIYHITNTSSCSWHELAEKIFELVKLNPKIEKIKSSDRPSSVKRPKYSVLISENLKKQGIDNLRPWPEALSAYLDEIKKACKMLITVK